MAVPSKKTDLGLLEEDDEFEEFLTEGIFQFCSSVIPFCNFMSVSAMERTENRGFFVFLLAIETATHTRQKKKKKWQVNVIQVCFS